MTGPPLITGATDGIGEALARLCRERGDDPVLVGRRPVETLDPSLFPEGRYCPVDLSRRGCDEIVETFLRERGLHDLGAVIHNAAGGYFGPVEAQTPRSLREMLEVNVATPIALTRRLIPYLRPGAVLAFISSVTAALPCPEYASYAASKAALEGFARSLRVELRGRFRVVVVRPGATRTRFHEKIGMDRERIGWHRFPDSEGVARRILLAIDRRRRQTTIGWGNRLLCRVGHDLAAPLDAWLRRRRS